MEAAMIFFLVFFAGLIFVVFTALMGGFGHGGGDVDASGSDFGADAGIDGSAGGDMGGADAGGSDIGGHDVGGHDGGGLSHFPKLSPLLMAISATTFGGFGWIFTVYYPWIGLVGIVISALVITALVSTAIFYGFIRAMSKMQASSIYRLTEAKGTLGTVTTPIEPGKIGVVDHELRGQNVGTAARSDDTLKIGDRVEIVDVISGVLQVKKAQVPVEEF